MKEEKVITNPFKDKVYDEYLKKLESLRIDGELKIEKLKLENRDIKLNKELDKETKQSIITKNNQEILVAKEVKKEKLVEVNKIIKEAILKTNEDGKAYYNESKEYANELLLKAKEEKKERKLKAKELYLEKITSLKEEYNNKISQIDSNDKIAISNLKKEYKMSLKSEKVSYRSEKYDIKNDYEDVIVKTKNIKNDAFLEKYNMQSKIRNNHHSILENTENYFKQYSYNFRWKSFLLKNSLYFIIIAFFIIVIIIGFTQGKNLFTYNHFMSLIGQSSQKVFYSLGVAGLILLAGTDLSVGRLTGVGASFVCMLLANQTYTSSWGTTLDITGLGWGGRVIIAILFSILICTIFTSIAGFFTAKFKMHPFITTLSTQLISFGLMMVLYADYPAFNMNNDIKKTLVGGATYTNLIIMAIITIAIVWFIWNKTKFGKNMYAVGGNAEAASVSGISVFWVTMGVFIMAGVLYGLGGYATAIQIGSANPSTGSGTELDAIAACVVGGISFSGGIGKISGAVVGTIIFTSMTYLLNFIGVDSNFQYIFKGIIIMSAVCLDSLKYLKKK